LNVIRVAFITSEGARVEAEAAPGDVLLDVAQAAGMPLEGTCEAQMACSTCHVILPGEWFDKLPPAVEDEENMLDLATGACRTSRLSCQIVLTDALDGIEVRIPAESRDMQRR
jgi:ferredoxin